MGVDIHCFAERKLPDGSYEMIQGIKPFAFRDYDVFSFFGVNGDEGSVPKIASPRGVPCDASEETKAEFIEWGEDALAASWLSIEELKSFDYRQRLNASDRWASDTFASRLGSFFFEELIDLGKSGVDRIVFWFDC